MLRDVEVERSPYYNAELSLMFKKQPWTLKPSTLMVRNKKTFYFRTSSFYNRTTQISKTGQKSILTPVKQPVSSLFWVVLTSQKPNWHHSWKCMWQLYLGVMKVWLVKLISIAKVYLRILVLRKSCWRWLTPPSISKRLKAWFSGGSKVYVLVLFES